MHRPAAVLLQSPTRGRCTPLPTVAPTFFLSAGLSTPGLIRPTQQRGALIVMANAKKSLGCTKGGTRRARARTSGFRTRMASPTGRKVLKGRRKKGRANLCPPSERRTGGK